MTRAARSVVPGFVDLQVNGFIGVDFSGEALTAEAFREASHALLARGTWAFLPTVITSAEAVTARNLALMAGALRTDAALAGRVLGFHLEGPFISKEPGAVGAHPPEHARPPDAGLFERLQRAAEGRVRLLTLAAELPGSDALARRLTRGGVAVSCGHQLASADDLARLAEAGATALTHLGNGMPEMSHRHHNPLLAGLAEDRLQVMFIPDGHHLPPHVLRLFARAAGPCRLIATSDASPVAGLPPGRYRALGNEVEVTMDGRVMSLDRGCLVGSSATLLQCMNVLHGLKLLTDEELLQVGIHNPLRLIGATAGELPVPAAGFACDLEAGFIREGRG